MSDNYKYLLDNSDLYLCQQNTPTIAEKLFDVLEQVCSSPESLKWVFQLHRKVMKKPVQPVTAAADVDPDSGPSSRTEDRSGSSSEDSSSDASEYVLRIIVLDSKYNKIKCKIEEIQQKTNTLVVLNCDDLDLSEIREHGLIVSIYGNVKNCKEAEVIVQNIVNEGETRSIEIWAENSILRWRIIELRQEARNYHVKVDVTNIIERYRSKVILTGLEEDIRSVSDYIDLLYLELNLLFSM